MLRVARRRAAARHRPPDHRHHRRRRRARLGGQPGRGRPARQPRPVRPGGRRLPGRRRRRHAGRAAGLPHRRGRPGQRPRRRDADRRRLGQAADRAPVQGPRVGLGVPGRRLRRAGSPATGPGRCGPRRPRCCPAPLRGDAADLPQLARLRQGGARRPTAPTPGRTTQTGGAPARLRRVHPRRAPALGHVVLLEPAADAVRSVGLPGASSASSSTSGASRSTWLDKPAKGDPNPYAAEDPSRPWPPVRHRRGGAARGSTRPRWCGPPTPRPRTTTSTWSRAARVADWDAEVERLLAEARAERSADDRGAAARQPVGDRAAAAAGRPGGVRPRAGPADAAAAVAGRPGSAPSSTPGSRTASSSSRCSTPTTCPAAPTSTSTTRPTSTR